MNFEKLKTYTLNMVYFAVVFIIALAISTQALARRVNMYDATSKPIVFSVEKERVYISNSVIGTVGKIFVETGQHVKKGDLLVILEDRGTMQRIQSLEELAEENLSARTELSLLRSTSDDYMITAPRDGVVYQIQAAEGSYLSMNSPVLTIFADSNVRVTGMVNQEQYEKIQKNKNLDVFSPRFEQVFQISFGGIGRVKPATAIEESLYEVKFKFSDQDEGAAFIDGENLEVVSKTDPNKQALKPSQRVTSIWNKLILGN